MTDPDFALADPAVSTAVAPIPSRLRSGRRPKRVTLPSTEYVGLSIMGALAVGLVVGLLLPRPRPASLSRKARAALKVAGVMAGEVGLAIAARSLSRAAPDNARADPQADAEPAGTAPADARLVWLRGAGTLITTVWNKPARK